MAGNTSPALARRQLRFALRRARDTAGLTQGQVADALEWSISKVNRIETGDVTVSATDLKALLGLLQVTEPAIVDEFTAHARASRRQGWWDQPEYKPYLTKATRQLIEFEGIASTIWCYQPITVPGILQTEAFAADIIAAFGSRHSPQARAAKVAIRVQRLQHVLDRPDPPEYRLLLDESVAIREVGGPKATADQFEHILSLADSRRIRFRIVPLRDGLRYAMTGSFTIFAVGVEEGPLLYTETANGDNVAGLPELVAEYVDLFEEAWTRSLSEEASARLLRARALTMLAEADRVSPAP